MRLESETSKCYWSLRNGVALLDRVLIKGLSKSSLVTFGPFIFWRGADCLLDKKLYPRGYEILKASAKACR